MLPALPEGVQVVRIILPTLQTYCDFDPSLRREKTALSPSLFLIHRLPRVSAEFYLCNLS